MSSQFFSLLFLCSVCLLSGCSSSEPSKPGVSHEMAAILSKHRISDFELSVAGMVSSDGKDLPSETSNSVEVYDVPPNPKANDTFTYRVLLDKTKQTCWIIRSGGFAGKTTVFGPEAVGNPQP